jgi:hypothetical protein
LVYSRAIANRVCRCHHQGRQRRPQRLHRDTRRR